MNELRKRRDIFLLRFSSFFWGGKLGFDFLQDNNPGDWEGETDAEELWEGGMKGRITRFA